MALENNLVVDSDAELKAFLSSILSSEGIVVNINRTFIAYNNGTNRNRVFARCANRMAQKGTDEKFVVIALMCYPALNWILKARDIDAMIEQLHDMDTDGSVRNISEIQSLLENSTGYVKPRLHLEMRKLFFARCQQLVDAVDDAMNRAVFRSAQPCKPARISLAMAMLRGSILDSDPVSAVMIRNNFDGIIEDIAKVGGEAIKELVLQLAPNEGVVQGAEAAYLYHNTEVLLREYSRITHPSSVDGNSTLRLIATAGNQLDASDHKSDARYAQAQILLQYEHEEEPGMDMMDLDVPAPPEPDIVDAPTLEQEPSMQDNAPEMPAKKTNAFGTLKAAATEPKVEPHESAKSVESHPTQPRPQKPDVPQTPKAEPKAEPVAPAQRPKADREAALAGFNITRKVEPSKEVKKPKKPITDKRTSTSKSSPKEDSAKAPKQKQPSKEAPAKSQKKPANEKQQNSDEPKKAQPFDQSFRKRGRGSSKKAQQSNGQISFEELH